MIKIHQNPFGFTFYGKIIGEVMPDLTGRLGTGRTMKEMIFQLVSFYNDFFLRIRNFPNSFSLSSLFACDHRDELSDAYGNFEADDRLIPAEATGKIIEFTIEEGMMVFAILKYRKRA